MLEVGDFFIIFFSRTLRLRVFFHFILSVLLENKTGGMSNRKMNTCLGCRIVWEVWGVSQACYLGELCNVQDSEKNSITSDNSF